MKRFVLLLFSLFCFSVGYAKERIVFIVNTTEHDERGGATTPYLDEYVEIQVWQRLYPDAKVIRIRSDNNEGIRKNLELWMRPNPKDKEVVGLFIMSHGTTASLSNEDLSFLMQLPLGIQSVFQPIVGHFAADARIVFAGCSILSDMSADYAANFLEAVRKQFGMKSGAIYANQVQGMLFLKLMGKLDLLNPEIPIKTRLLGLGIYATWPLSFPTMIAFENFYYNRGYLLQAKDGKVQVKEANRCQAMEPALLE